MVTEQGSQTAKRAAALRAVESERPAEERILDDPYAATFAGPEEVEQACQRYAPRENAPLEPTYHIATAVAL
ncbi:MAG: class I SAM-dependent methyltransferase [Nitrospinae bacterium]|nr:class I SAM-dependent methyltransferase [Nitrospinota bacterium]